MGFSNSKVRRLRLLVRQNSRREGLDANLFVIEGVKLLREAFAAGAVVKEIYFSEEIVNRSIRRPGLAVEGAIKWAECAAFLQEVIRTGAAEVFCLKEGVMDKVATTRTPQPVLALVKMVDVPLETFADFSFVVMAVDSQNPGNVGSLLRCAQAAGADGFIVGTTKQGSGVEFYNPKCIRATAGAVFKIPLAIVKEPERSLELLGSWGIMRLGAYPAGGVEFSGGVGLYDMDLKKPLCWVLGNESVGLPAGIARKIDRQVFVPTRVDAESLNLAAAGAVLCFETMRQRCYDL